MNGCVSRVDGWQVSFNGVYDGVYTVVEDIDEAFTEDRFQDDAEEGGGGLYKDAWVRSRSTYSSSSSSSSFPSS